jgi:hypothetical protein
MHRQTSYTNRLTVPVKSVWSSVGFMGFPSDEATWGSCNVGTACTKCQRHPATDSSPDVTVRPPGESDLHAGARR